MKFYNLCAGVPVKIRKNFRKNILKSISKKINNFMKNVGTPAQERNDKNVKK